MIDHKNILDLILPVPQKYKILKIENNVVTYKKVLK